MFDLTDFSLISTDEKKLVALQGISNNLKIIVLTLEVFSKKLN